MLLFTSTYVCNHVFAGIGIGTCAAAHKIIAQNVKK